MTDDQANKFLAIQIAQLAMLQNIANNVQCIAATHGKATGHHWGEIETIIKNATAILAKM